MSARVTHLIPKIITLIKDGRSFYDIEEEVGVCRTTIRRIANKHHLDTTKKICRLPKDPVDQTIVEMARLGFAAGYIHKHTGQSLAHIWEITRYYVFNHNAPVTPITTTQHVVIADMVRKHRTLNEICRTTDVARDKVSAIKRYMGIPKGWRVQMPQVRQDRIIALLKEGYSYKQIGLALNENTGTISRIRHRHLPKDWKPHAKVSLESA